MVPKERIDATPDISLMPKIGLTGYSLSEMIAELVDNSLDAAPEGKPVHVNIELGSDFVQISDDALGMSKEALSGAMRLAHSTKKNKLGSYGLGMKAACVAMGNKFTIDTAPVDGKEAYRVVWDADDWGKKGEWAFELERVPAAKGKHGTVIRIERLQVKAGGKVATLRVDLARRFGPFVRRGLAEITVEGKAVQAPAIEFIDEEGLKVPPKGDIDITLSNGSKVTGWVGLMKHSNQKGGYGFDTFRYGRMITTHDKIGFTQHATVARIVGELHMDDLRVTSNKREWLREDALYLEAVDAIKTAINPWLAEARRLSGKAKVAETAADKAAKERYKEGLAEALSAPELKEFTLPERKMPDGSPSPTTPDPKGKTEIDVPGREVRNPATNSGTSEATGTGAQRTPKKVDLTRTRRLRIKGKVFDYRHEWKNLGSEGPWMEFTWNEAERTLEIDSNADSPAVLVTQDRNFLTFLHVSDAIAQIIMEESGAGWEKFDEIRQVLIREAAKHVAQVNEVPATARSK